MPVVTMRVAVDRRRRAGGKDTSPLFVAIFAVVVVVGRCGRGRDGALAVPTSRSTSPISLPPVTGAARSAPVVAVRLAAKRLGRTRG